MKPLKSFVVGLALSLAAGLAGAEEYYKVVRVIDGDTIELEQIGTVRLIGVDTPETVHPSKPVEYFGKEASAFLRQLVEGKPVQLEYDQQHKDRYDRTLAYVYLGDLTFVNAEIIKQGYGHAYTQYPFKYMEQFRAHEREARENSRGLWADPEQGAAGGVTTGPAITTGAATDIVYITRTGTKYHRAGCRYLSKSKILDVVSEHWEEIDSCARLKIVDFDEVVLRRCRRVSQVVRQVNVSPAKGGGVGLLEDKGPCLEAVVLVKPADNFVGGVRNAKPSVRESNDGCEILLWCLAGRIRLVTINRPTERPDGLDLGPRSRDDIANLVLQFSPGTSEPVDSPVLWSRVAHLGSEVGGVNTPGSVHCVPSHMTSIKFGVVTIIARSAISVGGQHEVFSPGPAL